MEDKKQDLNWLEALVKTADSYRALFDNLVNELSKLLPDVEIPEEEEDSWKMKCPYERGDTHYCIQPSGDVFADCWEDMEADNKYFSQGNVFPTEEAAQLEARRRNLLTRFRAFRDECNGDWNADCTNVTQKKYYISYSGIKNGLYVSYIVLGNHLHTFSYFKNEQDAERAIELFGDEIKELFVDCEVQ